MEAGKGGGADLVKSIMSRNCWKSDASSSVVAALPMVSSFPPGPFRGYGKGLFNICKGAGRCGVGREALYSYAADEFKECCSQSRTFAVHSLRLLLIRFDMQSSSKKKY